MTDTGLLHHDFAALIDAALKNAGIPRSRYAEWLGVSPAAVSAILNGSYGDGVTFRRAERWAGALGLRLRIVAELVDDDEWRTTIPRDTYKCPVVMPE